MRRSAAVTLAILLGGVCLVACFEITRTGCPSNLPRYNAENGYCSAAIVGDQGVHDMTCSGAGCRDGGGDLSGADLGPECTDSSTCPAAAPLCAGRRCSPCNSNGNMTGPSAACSLYHSSTTPPTPLCGGGGACVQCLTNDDCKSLNQTCNLAKNICAPCVHNGDCSTGACKAGGACASGDEVYYVDNRNGQTFNGTTIHSIADCRVAFPAADGTSAATAFCDIADALAATMKRAFIVVKGSAVAYTNLTINTTPASGFTIIGPGHATPNAANSPSALVYFATMAPAVAISPAAAQSATVTIDGMELSGSSGNGNQRAGILCNGGSGTATVKVLDSTIDNSGDYGINASACSVTLDGNIISQNTGGGILLSGGTINASNNLIVLNGLSGPGVNFQGSVSGTFWFNTVADNTQSGSAGGFNCTGTAAPKIQASIMFRNSMGGGSSVVGTACVFSYSDVVGETLPGAINGTGNFNQDPGLTATGMASLPATGYRLGAGSPCLNKVTAATGLTGTLPVRDVDGTTRPRAATGGYDCGGAQGP